jgi:hypothetical protein
VRRGPYARNRERNGAKAGTTADSLLAKAQKRAATAPRPNRASVQDKLLRGTALDPDRTRKEPKAPKRSSTVEQLFAAVDK